MNKLNYELTHTSNYMNKIDDIIKWLSDKGLKAHCSRYSRYKNYIEAFYKTDKFEDLQ